MVDHLYRRLFTGFRWSIGGRLCRGNDWLREQMSGESLHILEVGVGGPLHRDTQYRRTPCVYRKPTYTRT